MLKAILVIVFILLMNTDSSYAQRWTAQSIDTYEVPTNGDGGLSSVSDWEIYKTKPTQYKYTYPNGSEKEEVISDWDLYKQRSRQIHSQP